VRRAQEERPRSPALYAIKGLLQAPSSPHPPRHDAPQHCPHLRRPRAPPSRRGRRPLLGSQMPCRTRGRVRQGNPPHALCHAPLAYPLTLWYNVHTYQEATRLAARAQPTSSGCWCRGGIAPGHHRRPQHQHPITAARLSPSGRAEEGPPSSPGAAGLAYLVMPSQAPAMLAPNRRSAEITTTPTRKRCYLRYNDTLVDFDDGGYQRQEPGFGMPIIILGQ
jgi:hypothetical protein